MAAPLRVERRIAVSTTLTDLESAVLPLNYGAFTGFSSSLKPKSLRFCRSIALTKNLLLSFAPTLCDEVGAYLPTLPLYTHFCGKDINHARFPSLSFFSAIFPMSKDRFTPAFKYLYSAVRNGGIEFPFASFYSVFHSGA